MTRPTDLQMAILEVLWDRGPSTVRTVHETLARERETGYTTTLKLMQVMAKRGMVTRDDESRSHVYAARWPRTRMQRHLVTDLIRRVFRGSASALVLEALNGSQVSPEELARIRETIDRAADRRRRRHD